MNIGILAGSFNPPTIGHIELLTQALQLFDKVIVLPANNNSKANISYSRPICKQAQPKNRIYEEGCIPWMFNSMLDEYISKNNLSRQVESFKSKIIYALPLDTNTLLREFANNWLSCDHANAINLYIIRGLRTNIDFEYERQLAEFNKATHNNIKGIETIYFHCESKFAHVSSSLVRELIKMKKWDYLKDYISENMITFFKTEYDIIFKNRITK